MDGLHCTDEETESSLVGEQSNWVACPRSQDKATKLGFDPLQTGSSPAHSH